MKVPITIAQLGARPKLEALLLEQQPELADELDTNRDRLDAMEHPDIAEIIELEVGRPHNVDGRFTVKVEERGAGHVISVYICGAGMGPTASSEDTLAFKASGTRYEITGRLGWVEERTLYSNRWVTQKILALETFNDDLEQIAAEDAADEISYDNWY